MKIEHIEIKNFRNLDNIQIDFHPEINFIVGENDLGKSNLLHLLDIIFNKTSFSEEDFFDREKDIEISLKISFNDDEVGVFDDCVDGKTGNITEIKVTQNIDDDRFKVLCNNNDDNINISDIRCINFIRYSSLRKPEEDFNISSNKGISKIFRFLIKKAIGENNINLLKEDEIKRIIDFLNNRFSKITIFKDFKLEKETEPIDLLARVLKIKDEKDLDIFKSGHGFQFSLILLLYIMEKIIHLKENKRRQNCIFGNNNQKSFSLILGLDEPEIHLHPFMQRQLIKELQKIIKNENDEFQEILKEIFSDEENIDDIKINGQIFIVTHSPYILLNDIQQIIRFYKNSKICVISGSNLNLDEQQLKHIRKNFEKVKEAFFSRCVILVEGDTEQEALPIWAKKTIGDLDSYGISVINGGGADSLAPLKRALAHFNIPTVIVIDKDKLNNYQTKHSDLIDENFFYTNLDDLESDLVENIFLHFDEIKIHLVKMLIELKGDGNFHPKRLENDIKILEEMHKECKFKEELYKTLQNEKNVNTGKIIGEYIPKNIIPCIYIKTLVKAKRLADGEI